MVRFLPGRTTVKPAMAKTFTSQPTQVPVIDPKEMKGTVCPGLKRISVQAKNYIPYAATDFNSNKVALNAMNHFYCLKKIFEILN